MKIIFFNPYADQNIKGAYRRIIYLKEILVKNGIRSNVIDLGVYKKLIGKTTVLLMLDEIGFRRIVFFIIAFALSMKNKYLIISEVIVAPVFFKNFILTIHDMKAFDSRMSRRGKWLGIVYYIFIKLANRVMVVSGYTKTQVLHFCNKNPSKILVVKNGLSSNWLKQISDSKKLRIKKYDYVYVSSFAKHKGHNWLIDNLPKGSSLLLIGRDLGALGMIEEKIAKRSNQINVTIRQDVNSDGELIDLLYSAKIGIFPSEYEGFGIPILEYASVGLPIIASRIPPFIELSEFIDFFCDSDIDSLPNNIDARVDVDNKMLLIKKFNQDVEKSLLDAIKI